MSFLRVWIFVVLAVPYIHTSPIANDLLDNNEIEESSFNQQESLLTKCSLDGGFNSIITCAATRALKLIEYASRSESLTIFPGVSLTSEKSLPQREGKSIKSSDLPTNLSERVDVLIQLVLDATSRFFSGRSIKIDIPEIAPLNSLEEGRAKSKKSGSPLMFILGAKVLLIKALLIAGLKFMSIKALILAKIALVISAVLAVQSLFGRGNGIMPFGGSQGSGWSGTGPVYGAPNYPSWTTNSIGGWTNSQYPYARSIDDDGVDAQTEAQDLAYSQQKP